MEGESDSLKVATCDLDDVCICVPVAVTLGLTDCDTYNVATCVGVCDVDWDPVLTCVNDCDPVVVLL